MANNKKSPKAEITEKKKVVTKYDKKVAKRKEAERRAKREKMITQIVFFCVVVALAVALVTAEVISCNKIYRKYIVIDGENVNQIEFDFYYGVTKNSELNTTLFSTMTYLDYYEQYLGYDSSKADSKQDYSEELTWYDYFGTNTVSSMLEIKALLKDAEANNFEYDVTDDYNDFIQDLKDAASSDSETFKSYLKEIFGSHATEKSIKSYVKDYLKAMAYEEELTDGKLAPSDSDIKSYYNDNKDKYDQFTFRYYAIEAGDSLDEAVNAAKEKAEAFKAGVTSEETFISQCKAYEEANGNTDYDETTSLEDAIALSDAEDGVQEWVADSSRVNGDCDIMYDSDNATYYVVYFISRSYDGSSDDTIKSTLLQSNYSDYIDNLEEGMDVDVCGQFVYNN